MSSTSVKPTNLENTRHFLLRSCIVRNVQHLRKSAAGRFFHHPILCLDDVALLPTFIADVDCSLPRPRLPRPKQAAWTTFSVTRATARRMPARHTEHGPGARTDAACEFIETRPLDMAACRHGRGCRLQEKLGERDCIRIVTVCTTEIRRMLQGALDCARTRCVWGRPVLEDRRAQLRTGRGLVLAQTRTGSIRQHAAGPRLVLALNGHSAVKTLVRG